MSEASLPKSGNYRTRLMLIGSGVVVTLVLLGIVLAPITSSILRPILDRNAGETHWGPQSSGQSLPLRALRDIAEREALKIDKGAEFLSLTVSSPGAIFGPAYNGPTTGSLELLFTYYVPSGNSITIWMEDAAPTSTLNISSSDDPEETTGMGHVLYGLAREGRSERQNLYDSVENTPRDAIASTWEDVSRYAVQMGMTVDNVYPVVYVDHLWGMPGKWTVQYWPRGDATKPASPEQGVSALTTLSGKSILAEYLVNGKTGAILEYKHGGHITKEPQYKPKPSSSTTPAK